MLCIFPLFFQKQISFVNRLNLLVCDRFHFCILFNDFIYERFEMDTIKVLNFA